MSPAEAEARFQQGWVDSFQKREARRKRFLNMRKNMMRLRRGEVLVCDGDRLEYKGGKLLQYFHSFHSTQEDAKLIVRVLGRADIRRVLVMFH